MADVLSDLIVNLSADFGDVEPKLASLSEKFDNVGTAATKTGSVIDQNLDSAIQNLLDKGETLAEALTHLNEGFAETVTGSTEAAEQLDLFNEQISVPYEDAAGQLNLFSDELEPIAPAAQDAGEEVEGASESLHEFAEAAEASAESAGELLISLLEFAGIALSLEAIKEATIETFEVFSKEERATEALTALTGSAKTAEETIAMLKRTSLNLAVPYTELLQANQRMIAFGFSSKTTEEALLGAANASRAMNKDFGSVSDTLSRIALSGQVSQRYLATLGISLKDLSAVLGVTETEANKAFRSLDVGERMEALSEVLQRFSGLAAKTANDLAGSWENFKTRTEFVFEDVGRELEPLAKSFTNFATDEIKAVGEMIVNVIKFGENVAELPSIVKAALIGVAAAFTSPAGVAVVASLQLIVTWKQLQDAEDGLENQNKDYAKSIGLLIIQQQRQFAQYPEFAEKFKTLYHEYAAGKVDIIGFEQGIRNLDAAFNKLHPELVQQAEGHRKSTAEIVKEKEATAALSKEDEKLNKQLQDLREFIAAGGDVFQGPKQAVVDYGTALDRVVAKAKLGNFLPVIPEEAIPDLKVLGEEVKNLGNDLDHSDTELQILNSRFFDFGGISKEAAEAASTAFRKLQEEVKATGKAMDAANSSVANLGKQGAEELGQLGVKSLDTILHAKDIGKAFLQVGKDIENSIIHFAIKALEDLIMKQIANAAATKAINAAIALQQIASMKAQHLAEKSIEDIAAAATVTTNAGIASAAAAASAFETLPYPAAVVAAPVQAAAAFAEVETAGAAALFEKGGDVERNMIGFLHAGETVLTEGQGSKLGTMIDKGEAGALSGQSNGGDTHIHINGATKDLMDQVWNYGVKQGRRSGVNW